MKILKSLALAGTMFAGLAAPHALAADLAPVPETSDWSFTVAAYLWASGLEGESGVFGLPPQDIDLSFGDVLDNLDFALMAAGEARNGALSIGMDFAYAKLGANVGTPVLADDIDVTAKTLMATGYVGYSLLDSDSARFDMIAGARLWSVNTDFDLNGGALGGSSFDDGATWVDPLVGAKLRADLGSDFYLSAWGMVGGFGVSSDFMWDVMGGVGYEVNETFSVFAGYRAVGVDYSDGSFVYDVVQQGPVLAGVFRF
jgi:hypothetical protein